MKRYRRNELQAREGIDTVICLETFDLIIQCRNELQAREGIDTIDSLGHPSYSLPNVEMSYKPERALTQDIAVSHLLALTMM